MQAWKEKTKCLQDIAGKGSGKASVQVQVKGIKYESPAPEPLVKDGKGEQKLPAGWRKGQCSHKIKR